jgi:hypothetical protein
MVRSIRWMWLGPVAFLVHDAEEVLVFEPWMRRHGGALPAPVRPLVAAMDTRQFAAAVLALLAGYLVASALGVQALRAGRRPWPYLVVTGAFVGNGLTHLLQAVVFGGYTPGVITAAVVSLPYGWVAGQTLVADGVVSRRHLVALIVAGVVLQVPLTWLALQAGRQLGAP